MTAASSTDFFHACPLLIAAGMTTASLADGKIPALLCFLLFLSQVVLLSITATSCATKTVHTHTGKLCTL